MAVVLSSAASDHCAILAPGGGTDDEGHLPWRAGCGTSGISARLGTACGDGADEAEGLAAGAGLPPSVPEPAPGGGAAERPSDTDSIGSRESELECPVCYHTYCEPVKAGCDRHIFCRQCLWRTQRPGEPLRCPICRATAPGDAERLMEVADLAAKLRKRDPGYEEREAAAAREREADISRRRDVRALLQELAARPSSEDLFNFEVSGAGLEESNGVYIVDVLPTYIGPTVYRKPNTHFFIYRWHRTQWVLAELREQSRMGSERAWLYVAPTQIPPNIPPATGWEVPRRSGGVLPAPEVRCLPRELPAPGISRPGGVERPPQRASAAAVQRARHVATRGVALVPSSAADVTPQATGQSDHAAEQAVAVREADVAARCRCSPQCSVM